MGAKYGVWQLPTNRALPAPLVLAGRCSFPVSTLLNWFPTGEVRSSGAARLGQHGESGRGEPTYGSLPQRAFASCPRQSSGTRRSPQILLRSHP